MNKTGQIKLGNIERFEVEITKEFRKECFYLKIEKVKDVVLKRVWYNVIWCSIPGINILPKELLRSMYVTKSKSYRCEKDAIQHFNNIIKSQLL